MEEKTATLKDKLEDFKIHAKWKWEDLKQWSHNNKDWLVIAGPIVLGSVVELTKIHMKSSNIREERRLKENYIYDARMHHYCQTRRKLKPKEWRIFDERYSAGESASSILDDLRLSK